MPIDQLRFFGPPKPVSDVSIELEPRPSGRGCFHLLDCIYLPHVYCYRVKIVQQRPLLAELLENEGDTRDSNFLEEEDRIFGWQEKVFSPFEVNFYSEETNCLTECQKVYYRQIKERSIEGSQLYTYTQNDSYYLGDELLTKRYKTKLAIKNQTALPA